MAYVHENKVSWQSVGRVGPGLASCDASWVVRLPAGLTTGPEPGLSQTQSKAWHDIRVQDTTMQHTHGHTELW